MKEVRYEFIVKMETGKQLADQEAESLALDAAENMRRFVRSCGDDIGLDDITMLEGRLFIDGEERCRVGCGVAPGGEIRE